MEDDERKLPVRRVLRNGRRRYDAASKARLVAACLEPGVSVSRLALEHGINTNLLRKWIKTAREAQSLPPSATSAFIPVVAADRSSPMQGSVLDMPATRGDGRLAASHRTGRLSSPARLNASLPNGVELTLECGDVDGLTAMSGALGDVQAGR
ncbi:IS66-like element accessory protein TnpA [Phyllobacterium leguminum]|uniref:IS66-like element accessory protein TnpA n=1 Tax=Phyllobacterium leguminum TaxID=314237 RepID=UPI0015E8AFA5|nr:transposase [Phyllobacterium leguminum]